jgi:hypothetical protein
MADGNLLRGISVIRTPALGVKYSPKLAYPRPSCQWYVSSVAIIECRTNAAAKAASIIPAISYKMDAGKKVPSWSPSGGKEKPVKGVPGLTIRYLTPTRGEDQAYDDGHRMHVYHLDGTSFYLFLVHDDFSNNKKRRREE